MYAVRLTAQRAERQRREVQQKFLPPVSKHVEFVGLSLFISLSSDLLSCPWSCGFLFGLAALGPLAGGDLLLEQRDDIVVLSAALLVVLCQPLLTLLGCIQGHVTVVVDVMNVGVGNKTEADGAKLTIISGDDERGDGVDSSSLALGQRPRQARA